MWQYLCSHSRMCCLRVSLHRTYVCENILEHLIRMWWIAFTSTGLRMWEYYFVHIQLCDGPGFSFAGKTQDLCILEYSCIHMFYERVSPHRTDILPMYVRIFLPLCRKWCISFFLHRTDTGLRMWDYPCSHILYVTFSFYLHRTDTEFSMWE
jgi:hypothetical protein